MHLITLSLLLSLFFCSLAPARAAAQNTPAKKRKILVVSSYNRDYQWCKETNAGLCAGLLKFGYLDEKSQAEEFTENDSVETSKIIMRKLWMDTKRRKSKEDKARVTLEITVIAEKFRPDLIFLGDDDAAKYIGNQFLDTETPLVFWGVNNTPVKYGLVDSIRQPGHNATGVYQPGYYVESLKLLKAIVPSVKTFAVISDESEAGRTHSKTIEYLALKGLLPLKYTETVSTENFETWKEKVLELQGKVDAFFVAQYGSLRDNSGNYVLPEDAARWFAENVTVPEAVEFRSFVEQGFLCGSDDSGFKQGYEAAGIAHDILEKRMNPATYPPRAPARGALTVNRQRAQRLGLTPTREMGVEEFLDTINANDKGQK
ncbi:MAG: ABC transporter substrate-binding protein [Endomicrobiales bacterium]